jgi:hypothetical protein
MGAMAMRWVRGIVPILRGVKRLDILVRGLVGCDLRDGRV